MTDNARLPHNPAAETALVGACLVDPDAVIFAAPVVSPAAFHTPVTRWLAQAVWSCYEGRSAPTLGNVIDKLAALGKWSDKPAQGRVCQADIQLILNAVTDSDITHIRANAQVIAENAIRRNGYTETTSGAGMFLDLSMEISEVQARLNASLNKVFDKTGRDPSITTVAEEEEVRLEKLKDGQLPGVACGLAWLDKLTGGFMPAENWVISGAYKFRKTTLALNFALAVAEAGVPISVLTNGDSTRDATFRKMLSMAMCREMAKFPESFPVAVSSKTLQYRLHNSTYEDLRQTCARQLRALPVYLYDGRDLIGNLNAASTKLRRDAAVNGVKVFVYDYAQTCQHGRDDYEKTTFYSGWCQAITGELGLTGITLSQRNEESIKDAKSGQSYSPGTKGGGALPAMANVLLETKYIEPNMTVTLKLSRDSAVAKPMVHRLNPESGLILDAYK